MNINKIKYHISNMLFMLAAIWTGIVICGIGTKTSFGLIVDTITIDIIVFVVIAKLQPRTCAIIIVSVWNMLKPIIYKSICMYEKIYKEVKKNANKK